MSGGWQRGVRWARRWFCRPLDALGVLLLCVYAAPSFAYPILTDQPIHWYIGRDILAGHFPYETATSTKAPLTFVFHAIGIALFGGGMWVTRLIDLVMLLVAAGLIATFRPQPLEPRPDSRPRDGELGAAAVLLGGFFYTYFDCSDTGHPETWQGVLVLLSGWVVVRAPGFRVSARRALVAGMLASLAVTIKHIGVVPGVAVGGAATLLAWPDTAGARLRNAAAYTFGTVLVMGLMVGAFWLGGAWDVLYRAMYVDIVRYSDQTAVYAPLVVPWMRIDQGLPAVLVGSAGLLTGIGLAWRQKDRGPRVFAMLVVSLCLFVALGAILPRRALFSYNYSYYWLFLVPFMALSVSWALRSALRKRAWVQLLVAVALVGAAFLSAPRGSHQPAWNYRYEWASWVAYMRGERSFTAHHTLHANTRFDSYVHMEELAAYIRSRQEAGDTLCLDGFIVGLYPMTGLRCNSRFIIGDIGPPYQAEQHRRLREDPPRFFVTFGDRPERRAELRELGYRTRDFAFPDGASYVIAELPREPREDTEPDAPSVR